MAIVNNVHPKTLQKVIGSVQRDMKSLMTKPQMGMFYGERVKYNEVKEDGEKVLKKEVDLGCIAFNRQKGNVLIKNPLGGQRLFSEQSDLLIYPISMDQNIYQDYRNEGDKVTN